MPDLGFPLVAIAVVIVIIYLLSSIKILAEYERGVIFRLGRLLGTAKGPGVILVFTPIDRMVRVSLRQEALEVPPQDIITRDNVTLKVNAVIFLRVIDPNKAVVEVSNYVYQTSQFAQTTLRSVLGEQELDELLAHREKINLRLQSILDTHTAPWGVKVANVEVKQVDMPESMLRAMAKQAEAEREKRSKIIHAEGEFSAAQRLVDAAHLLATEPVDLRRGHDGLVTLVRTLWKADPYSGTLFVFFGRRQDRIKVLFFSAGGFVVYYKRLERGRFSMPRIPQGASQVVLDPASLAMLLDGVDLRAVRRAPMWQPPQRKSA